MPIASVSYVSEISAQLSTYRDKGQKEAAAHRPPADATHPDANEDALSSEAQRWLAVEQKRFDDVVTDASRATAELRRKIVDLQMRTSHLLSESSLVSAIEADMTAERNLLVAAAESRMRAEVDWRHFRQSNNISEQAVYPESHIWHFAIIVFLALIETGINAFFYENSQGLLGGFTVALGVAAINMGSALIFGIFFRYKNLAAPDLKLLGWTCLIAFVLSSIYFNALFSAFRAEYQLVADPNDIHQMREAFAAALAESGKIFFLKMRIMDLMSLILFALGILLSGIAFYKGYTIDDKYPGHGRRDRAVNAARKFELAQQDLVRQRVKDYLHHRRAEVQAASSEPGQIGSLAAKSASELELARTTLRNQAQSVQRDFSMVLGAYRSANVAVRASPPPGYFQEVPNLKNQIDENSGDVIAQQFLQLQNEVTQLREKFQDSLSKKLQDMQGEAATILRDTFTAFLRDVEKDAHDRLDRSGPAINRPA